MNERFFSTDHEPALGARANDPSASDEAPVNSVTSEPALADQYDESVYANWLVRRRAEVTFLGNISVTLMVALMSGPMAVFGAFLAGRQTWFQAVYLVLFGPIVEELLKQAGMIYLLEKEPYRLFSPWQFAFAAVMSGLGFATIENLMYLYVYVPPSSLSDWGDFARFRLIWCTLLHVVCAMVATLGLIRAWRIQLRDGQPARLERAFPWFFAAISIHGAYNLTMLLLRPF